jgi:hypothetical protein
MRVRPCHDTQPPAVFDGAGFLANSGALKYATSSFRRKPESGVALRRTWKSWIPAFAGMTIKNNQIANVD